MPLRHESLVVWQRADDLFIDIHKLTLSAFPPFERHELGSQTRRAAFSVVVNIVEGTARPHLRERLQFLNIARASLAELAYCVHAARRLGYLDDQRLGELDTATRRVGAALAGDIRAIKDGRVP